MKPTNATKPANNRCVGVYIFNDDGSKVLLTQRGPGARNYRFKWEGPGGALEPGESYEQAAHREILEELGIHIELGEVLGEFFITVDDSGDVWDTKIFSATTKEIPSIQEPTKCVGIGWFGPHDAVKLDLADYAIKDMQLLGWM